MHRTRSALCLSLAAALLAVSALLALIRQDMTRILASGPFVTRTGSTLLLNSQPFRFVGVNRYDLLSTGTYACGAQWSTSQIDQWMAEVQRMGGTVIRFWAFQYFTASGTDFSRLDYLLQDAAAHNIHVIPALENQWGACTQGGTKGSTWYATGYQSPYGSYPESFIAYVNQIVPRYAANPTIVAWQIMNEAEDTDFAGFYNFASDLSGRIRALDPNHLISFGTMGAGQAGSTGTDYDTLHSLPTIDLLEYHDYNSDSTATPSWLAQREQDAVTLNKPLFVGEAGILSGVGLATRAGYFQAKMQAFFGAGQADAGYLIWSYRDPSDTSYGDGYNFLTGDPLVAVVQAQAGALAGAATSTGTATAAATPSPSACPSGWSCADIGSPLLAGGQSLSSGVWAVSGAGGDIWGTSDQFHFAWQALAGDGSVAAHVLSQTNTDAYAKAGVMLRQSGDPGSPFYMAVVTPGHGILVQYRATQGASALQATALAGAVPAYLRVARAGTTFTAYTSSDGSAWTPVPNSSATLSMPSTVLAGLAVTSHNANAVSTATFDTVSVAPAAPATASTTPTQSPLPSTSPTGTATAAATPSPSACPSGWSCADIGSPLLAGGQSLSSGVWAVSGAGGDIWGTSDQFHFAWQALAGDGSVSAHVLSQTNTDAYAKAGVMLRQSGDPGSPFYMAVVTPGHGILVQYRATQGASALQATALAGAVPAYLRVARAGTTFTAYTSSDGSAWTPVPNSSVTLSMPSNVLAGLAVTAHNANAVSTATFDTVSIASAAPATASTTPTQSPLPTASPTGTPVPPTATATKTPVPPTVAATTTCPSSWNCADIGNPSPAGVVSQSGNQWTIAAGGPGLGGTADSFTFVWQPITGYSNTRAHVLAQTDTDPSARIGAMYRDSTGADAAFYAVLLTPAHSIQVAYRLSQGAAAQITTIIANSAATYVKALRSGNSFMAYTSLDGVTWTHVAGADASITMNPTALAGAAVASHASGVSNVVTLDTFYNYLLTYPTATPSTPVPPTATASASTALVVTSPLQLSANTVANGGSLTGRATLQNQGSETIRVDDIVIAGRPPGGTNLRGPYLDFGGSGRVTLAPGQSITLQRTRTFTNSDPTGSWHSYVTYQTPDGLWHDDPRDVSFTITSSAPAATNSAATTSPAGEGRLPSGTSTGTNTPLPPSATAVQTSVPDSDTSTDTPIPATSTSTATPMPSTRTATITPMPPTNTVTNTPLPLTSSATITFVPGASTVTSTPTALPSGPTAPPTP